MILGIVAAFLITPGLLPPLGLPVLLEEPLADGRLVVMELDSPLTGGDSTRLVEVGVLLADKVVFTGAV